MDFKKILTPENTEEIRPGLFVQSKTENPDNIIYRVVNPICWKGKYRWKRQFGWRNVITIAIILFLAFTYFNDTSFCRALQEDPCQLIQNISSYCLAKTKLSGVNYEGADSFTLQNYP